MLISRSDIQTVIQLSDNLPAVKLDPYISRAQEMDLKPQLGPGLYKAFVDGVDAETAIYLTLLNGESYLCGTDTIDYSGIKPALAWFAYARYLGDQDSYSTVNGIVQPISDHSQPLSEKAVTRKINQAREAAGHYIDEMHAYLCEKSATYTLYNGDKLERRRTKVKITAIG